MCHVVLEYLFNGKRKGILLIFVDVVGVTTYLNYTNYTCYGIRECELLIPVDVVVVTTYVNVHRCQEDDGRVQLLMVERPPSLKLGNKQRIHYNGSDQYIKN